MNAVFALALVSLASAVRQDDGVRVAVSPQVMRAGQVLEFHEVRDLLADLGKDFEAPALGVPSVPTVDTVPGSTSTPERTEADELAAIEAGGKVLEELVRFHIEPAIGSPNESVRCTKAGTLVANLLPVQQEWVESFLKGLRDFDGYVEVRARFLRAPKGLLKEWKLTPSATLDTQADLDALHARIDANGRFDLLQAPTLVTFPMQRASISTTNSISYVKDWKLEIVEPGRREIADPQVAVILEGIALDVRAVPLPNGLFGLALEVQDCKIERPIATRQLRLGANSDQVVEIGVPDVRTVRFSASVLLASGASAVLTAAGSEPDKDLAVIVTARKVEREPVERR
jgi:hypothetical protein